MNHRDIHDVLFLDLLFEQTMTLPIHTINFFNGIGLMVIGTSRLRGTTIHFAALSSNVVSRRKLLREFMLNIVDSYPSFDLLANTEGKSSTNSKAMYAVWVGRYFMRYSYRELIFNALQIKLAWAIAVMFLKTGFYSLAQLTFALGHVLKTVSEAHIFS